MINVSHFMGKKTFVYGLGKSGKSAAHSLAAGGSSVIAWDDNEKSREALINSEAIEDVVAESKLTLEQPIDCDWQEIAALVLSPGVPLTHPQPHPVVNYAKKSGCPIICDIELLYLSNPSSPNIAITGTNGKSTTTSLIGHIFKTAKQQVQVGGNIGTPVLELDPLDPTSTYVLEVSSYQIDLLDESKFDIAIMLNISPDHLDRHGGMDGYVATKKKIFDHLKDNATAIIGIDDAHSENMYQQITNEAKASKIIPISCKQEIENGISVLDGVIIDNVNGEKYELGKLANLVGQHNQQNIAAAYAATITVGLKAEDIINAIKSFHGLEHRLQLVDVIDGITFINDSKGTNLEATEKAISAFENIYWIAGGIAKENDLARLEPLYRRINHVFLIGEAEQSFAQMLEGKLPYTRSGELDKAVQSAFDMAQQNNSSDKPIIILFSPACASFDQWINFEERGNAFCNYVSEQKKRLEK